MLIQRHQLSHTTLDDSAFDQMDHSITQQSFWESLAPKSEPLIFGGRLPSHQQEQTVQCHCQARVHE